MSEKGNAGLCPDESFADSKSSEDPRNSAGRSSRGASPMLLRIARREMDRVSFLNRDIIAMGFREAGEMSA